MAEAQLVAGPRRVEERHPAAAEGRDLDGVEALLHEPRPRDGNETCGRPEQLRAQAHELGHGRRLLLGQVAGLPEGARRRPEGAAPRGPPHPRRRAGSAFRRRPGRRIGPAIQEAPEVALEAAMVVALAVHHGDAQAGGREAVGREGRDQGVLGAALAHAVVPLRPVGGIPRRLRAAGARRSRSRAPRPRAAGRAPGRPGRC